MNLQFFDTWCVQYVAVLIHKNHTTDQVTTFFKNQGLTAKNPKPNKIYRVGI